MSHKFSNLFASRIYAEHPMATWGLDDEVFFLSLLSQSNKDISNWEKENVEIPEDIEIIRGAPLTDQSISVFLPESSVENYLDFTGPRVDEERELDSSKSTICVSSFVYPAESVILSFEIGFKYKNEEDLDYTFDTQEFSAKIKQWQQIIHTIEVPDAEDIRPYLKITYTPGIISDSYAVFINATSVGQWSEMHHRDSTGTIPVELTDTFLQSLLPNADPGGIKVIEADSYGILQNKNGYYIVDNNKMLAYNTSLPMVFGSSNLTNISSPVTPKMPSIVLPGQGFLNETGRYKELTAEFWLKVYTSSRSPKKIFGPLASNDGLYLEEEFLTLRVGKYTKSYFVGKWYRPMLINITYNQDIVSLLINGDLVFSFDIDQKNLRFPTSSRDWLGFFGDERVYPFEIDCVSIYPYIVSEQIAKTRFVYGQGVLPAENIVGNLGGESTYVDFPFANYSSIMNYPDMNSWSSGFFNNLDANSRFLTFPEYTLPEINYVGENLDIFTLELDPRTWEEASQRTWDFWTNLSWEQFQTESAASILEDNFLIQDGPYPFIKLKPTSAYENVDGSIYFDSMNPISSPVKSVFGMFRAPEELPSEPEIVMQFNNRTNSNLFKIVLSDEGLKYIYNDIVLATKNVSASADFVAGIQIDKINVEYFSTLNNFFSSLQNISLSLGGYGLNTFSGRIYSTTFNNKFFSDKDLSEYIGTNGLFGFGENYDAEYSEDYEDIFDYIGNYTFHPLLLEDDLIVDIGAIGYWEDSLPLTYFAKFVKNRNGQDYYDLDLIQFNIDNPGPVVCSGNLTQCGQRDLRVNSFITIQDFTQVGRKSYSDYVNKEIIGSNRVLDIDEYTFNDIQNTKFEIVDNTVIYPPKELVDFKDFYITTHIEMRNQGILSRDVKLKRMSYASLAFDETDFYSINTRTGNKIFPFTRYDNAYSFKDKNPFVINKESNPYMYLSSESGINVLSYDTPAVRGITIPINQQKNSSYILGGVQFWMFYNKNFTIDRITPVGKIKTATTELDIYLVPESNGQRGFLKVYNSFTGVEELKLKYYHNGDETLNPVIYPQLWSSIVISFDEEIFLDNQIGQFELYEGFVYNNIAMYKKGSVVFGSNVISRTWNELTSTVVDIPGPIDPTIELSWNYWTDFTWQQVLAETKFVTLSLDGSEIYQSFFGLSKGISTDNSKVLISTDSFKIVSDVIWEQFDGRPV